MGGPRVISTLPPVPTELLCTTDEEDTSDFGSDDALVVEDVTFCTFALTSMSLLTGAGLFGAVFPTTDLVGLGVDAADFLVTAAFGTFFTLLVLSSSEESSKELPELEKSAESAWLSSSSLAILTKRTSTDNVYREEMVAI